MIIGIDDVGNGSICGPVVVAAAVTPNTFKLKGLRDSKKLTPRKREKLEPILQGLCQFWVIAGSTNDLIDKYGLQACKLAAFEQCAFECRRRFPKAAIMIDGTDPIEGYRCSCIIKGDDLIPTISAASVLAKVYRDRYMNKLADQYPAYGFEQHKGYPTPHHIEVLRRRGPTPFHRLSTRPLQDLARR